MPMKRFQARDGGAKKRRRMRAARKFRRMRRTNYKRKMRRFRRSGAVSRYGFARNKLVRMKWWGGQDFYNSDADLHYLTYIKMNDPYDPWGGATGFCNKSAAGYKLYAQLYHRITVIGAKLVATIRLGSVINLNATSYDSSASVAYPPLKWGVKLDDDGDISTYTASSWLAMASDPDNKHATYQPGVDGSKSQTLTVKYSPYRMFGVKDVKDELETLGALSGGHPTKICYAVPWRQPINTTTYQGNIAYFVSYRLYMTCLLTEPFDLGTTTGDFALVEE